MASVFGSAITAFCISAASGSYNDACTHAVDAATRQVGWRQQVDYVEDKTLEVANKEALRHAARVVGKEGITVLAAGGYVYRVVKEKSLSFRLPTLGLCNSVSNQITYDSYRLVLEWKW